MASSSRRKEFAPSFRAYPGGLEYQAIEQMWRYYAVKEDAFAHQTPLPEKMLTSADLYPAYLVQNVLPGDLQDPAKSAGEMLAVEGVVSTLFYRWATSDAIRHRYREDAFYDRFGAEPSAVTPLENCYLKRHVGMSCPPSISLPSTSGPGKA